MKILTGKLIAAIGAAFLLSGCVVTTEFRPESALPYQSRNFPRYIQPSMIHRLPYHGNVHIDRRNYFYYRGWDKHNYFREMERQNRRRHLVD